MLTAGMAQHWIRMDGLDIIVLELKNEALGTRGKGRIERAPTSDPRVFHYSE